jgi:hypothetical protein
MAYLLYERRADLTAWVQNRRTHKANWITTTIDYTKGFGTDFDWLSRQNNTTRRGK